MTAASSTLPLEHSRDECSCCSPAAPASALPTVETACANFVYLVGLPRKPRRPVSAGPRPGNKKMPTILSWKYDGEGNDEPELAGIQRVYAGDEVLNVRRGLTGRAVRLDAAYIEVEYKGQDGVPTKKLETFGHIG